MAELPGGTGIWESGAVVGVNVLFDNNTALCYTFFTKQTGKYPGGVSERFKEPVLKTGDSKEPWVRIPPPPPLVL